MTSDECRLVYRAVDFVTAHMYGKFDRVGKPMILHSLRVGGMGKTADEMAVGFLHDVLEDTGATTYDMFHFDFPQHVITAVEALTHVKPGPTYREYIRALKYNSLATAVKLNDLIDNIGRVHELPDEKERIGLFDRWTWARLFLTDQHE